MHEVIFEGDILGKTYTITGWKIIGYLGVFLFAGRWFVQLYASKKKGRTHMPDMFWYMSVTGSLMLLSYFIFGKNDSVGILANLFPAAVASYNLFLNYQYKKRKNAETSSSE